jgi:hypothetical protein
VCNGRRKMYSGLSATLLSREKNNKLKITEPKLNYLLALYKKDNQRYFTEYQ